MAAKEASSFDSEMSKLNAELFPTETKAVWHHKSPADIRKHWQQVSASTMGKGGDELARKAAFASSPKAIPAAGKSAVKRSLAVNHKEALTAAEQAASEIEHIKALTEATFPTMKKAVDEKQTAAQMAAVHSKETNSVFPARFAKQEKQGKTLMAKKLARVAKAQAELFGRVASRKAGSHAKLGGIIKEANAVAAAQHRVAQEEKKARMLQKQKNLAKAQAAHGPGASKGAAGHKYLPNWMGQKKGPAGKGQAQGKPQPSGRKPISSDFAVSSEGTNVAFLGASQAGDKYFHAQQSVKKQAAADNKEH